MFSAHASQTRIVSSSLRFVLHLYHANFRASIFGEGLKIFSHKIGLRLILLFCKLSPLTDHQPRNKHRSVLNQFYISTVRHLYCSTSLLFDISALILIQVSFKFELGSFDLLLRASQKEMICFHTIQMSYHRLSYLCPIAHLLGTKSYYTQYDFIPVHYKTGVGK